MPHHPMIPSVSAAASILTERIVHFAADRPVGILYMRPVGYAEPYSWFSKRTMDTGWRRLGVAQGPVRVPAGMELQLLIPDCEQVDLTPLKQLPPDALHEL